MAYTGETYKYPLHVNHMVCEHATFSIYDDEHNVVAVLPNTDEYIEFALRAVSCMNALYGVNTPSRLIDKVDKEDGFIIVTDSDGKDWVIRKSYITGCWPASGKQAGFGNIGICKPVSNVICTNIKYEDLVKIVCELVKPYRLV